ncbi:site-specific DNA-methyltransferase [Apilactobacillus bombintestini]|uniref:Site-specific DNA-methyltransferase n=1 Tax=Apilactobacillus bombintestini TaxID=2419772 RepID=A0A387AQX8_9LACO|nr:site-specific DNA-methyltransferase [Apilactobacillus bombintestini]AYF92383.1 site-specific DNA-methyltransferase [Apilactobacillus bombintestini]
MDSEDYNPTTPNFRTRAAKKIAKIFPEVVTDGKIDFESLQESLSPDLEKSDYNEKFEFTWRGKKDAKKIADAPSKDTTLIPDKNNSKFWNNTKNIYIEGDNLEVLKLLQNGYGNKVDLIYLDPPYNTGKDFIYHDDFHNGYNEYLQQTGQKNDNGEFTSTNHETNGRFHTDWLNMMYPRLKLARKLLSEKGVIFVNISDTEAFNLKKVMDEIFGENNFVSDIIWNSTKSVTNTAIISGSTTHTLTYFKDNDYFVKNRTDFRIPDSDKGFSNPDNDPRGPWKADPFQTGGERPNQLYDIVNPNTGKVYKPNPGSCWKNDKNKFDELMSDNRIVFGKNGLSGPQRKRFLFEAKERGKVVKTLWDDVDTTTNGTARVKELFGSTVFSNPKPVKLLERIIQLGTDRDSIVVDFFSGSATTAEAVFNVNAKDYGNRKFILVQLPENLDVALDNSNSNTRQIIKNAIQYLDDNNQSHELGAIGRERIRLAGEDILSRNDYKDLDIGFKTFKLSKTTINQWDENPEHFEEQLKLIRNPFTDASTNNQRALEIAIKSGISLDINPEINDDIYHYVSEDKEVFIILGEYDMSLIGKLNSKRKKKNAKVVLREMDDGSEIKFNLIELLKQSPELNDHFSLEWI